MAENNPLLGALNNSGGSGGGTDKLEDRGVQAKLQKYYSGVADTKPNESVDRMKTRNAARRFAKGLPVRGKTEEPKVVHEPYKPEPEELKINEGHTVFGADAECEEGGVQWGRWVFVPQKADCGV